MIELLTGVLYCAAISLPTYGLTKLYNWMNS